MQHNVEKVLKIYGLKRLKINSCQKWLNNEATASIDGCYSCSVAVATIGMAHYLAVLYVEMELQSN